MSKTTKVTALVIRKLWTLIAVLLVTVALLISLLRYSLPLLDDRKYVIEQYVATEYGIDLSVGSVAATWTSNGPSLQLNDVYLRQGDQSPISLKVRDVYLAVKFWPSIFSGKLQSRNVRLSDLHLTLDLQRLQSGSTHFPIIKALETVFLTQLSNFSVVNSELTLLNNRNQNTIRIRQLSWLNRGNRHQGLGELSLQGFASNTASFVLDLQGNVDSYNGTLFAKGSDLDISPWLSGFSTLNRNLLTSKGNFAVWADIAQGEFTAVRGSILPSEFDWTTAQDKAIETDISAEFAATPSGSAWQFSIADLAVIANENTFNSNWSGTFSTRQGIAIHNNAPLDLSSLLPLSALFAANTADALNAMQFSVEVPSVHLKFDARGLHAVSQNNQLSWSEYDAFPGIEAIQLDLFWSSQNGRVRLHTKDSQIQALQLLDRTLNLQSLDMSAMLSANGDGWSFSSTDGLLQLDGISMSPDLSYSSADGVLSLITEVQTLPLAQVPNLLPKRYMGKASRNYLSNAFVGQGRVTNAHILWQGRPSDFPFDNQTGTFQAAVAISDADFLFSKAWPALSKLNIDLLFENKSLNMRANSGLLAGVELSNLRATIPTLTNNAMLTILADGRSDGTAIAELMMQSSLRNSLGKVLSQDVVISGPVNTHLALYIPLADAANTRAVGEAKLAKSDIHIDALGLDLVEATGIVAFDNKNLSIRDLDASLLAQAVSIDLIGKQEAEAYSLNIDIQGNWQIAPILTAHVPDLNNFISGSADWQLGVDVLLQGPVYDYTAELHSALEQINSSLPAPLEKTVASALPLTVFASGNNIASNIEIKMGQGVTFEGLLPHKERQFSRAHLALGKTDFVGMGVGFSISANLPSIDAQKWFETVSPLVGGLQSPGRSLLSVPERVFVQTDQLLLAGTRITDVNLTAKRLEQDWMLEINADEVRANVDISNDWVSKGIRIDADYVNLNEFDFNRNDSLNKRSIDPKTLPAITFDCESCVLSDINLGRVTFAAQPNENGLEITRLLMETDAGNINAQGQWYQRREDHYTFVAGDLSSSDFGRLLSNFGLDSGVKDSQAKIDFALTWKDAPMDFGFAQLDGQIDWDLTDGYLTEVSDKGSRIFTLLSLNSLLRKLSLDFRDVFAKGFFYDEMSGSLQITDGKADTRDTNIDGAAGEIEIYGYTDLVSKELNYNISFAPNVTGNLPVLVYFFTVSPPSALAALAIDQVLTSAKVISNVNYAVSGTIDDPVLIETGRESTEVELPTRRSTKNDVDTPEFLPPTAQDILPMEHNDG